MRCGALERDVHRELILARVLDGNLDAVPVTVIVLAPLSLIVGFGLGLPGALILANSVASAGALTWLAVFRRPRISARVERVLEAVRDRPDTIAEVAHRGSVIELFVTSGDAAAFLVPADRAPWIIEALAARCTQARVHAGRPSAALRAAPVARLVDRT